jgi:hypothetical protein
MVLHDSFLQYVQLSLGPQNQNRRPPPPPRHDSFAALGEKIQISVVKDVFLNKYLSNSWTSLEFSSFGDVALEDRDSLCEWMRNRLDALEYDTKAKGISHWEYDACHDEIVEIFFFSPIMAKFALKAFIKYHTRRMSAAHLGREDLPFFFTARFPVSKLKYLSIFIDAGTGKSTESALFDTLIRTIPDVHLTFTGLESLNIEITRKPQNNNDTSLLPTEQSAAIRDKIENVAIMLSLASRRFPRITLSFKEQMIFGGDWNVDKQALSQVLHTAYSTTARPPEDSLPVTVRRPQGSKHSPKVWW